jgi:hypothetical protein
MFIDIDHWIDFIMNLALLVNVYNCYTSCLSGYLSQLNLFILTGWNGLRSCKLNMIYLLKELYELCCVNRLVKHALSHLGQPIKS